MSEVNISMTDTKKSNIQYDEKISRLVQVTTHYV